MNNFLHVVAVYADNHVCNQLVNATNIIKLNFNYSFFYNLFFKKFFTYLCGGELSCSINQKIQKREQLFILFDFTHNF